MSNTKVQIQNIIDQIKTQNIPDCEKELTESSNLLKTSNPTSPDYSEIETNFNNVNQKCTSLIDMKKSLEDFLNNQTPENKKKFLVSKQIFEIKDQNFFYRMINN